MPSSLIRKTISSRGIRTIRERVRTLGFSMKRRKHSATAVLSLCLALWVQADPTSQNQLLWSGNLTPTSITVKAGTLGQTTAVLEYIKETSLHHGHPDHVRTARASTDKDSQISSFHLTDLAPDTAYRYWLVRDGKREDSIGRFRTPKLGPQSFKIALSSCAGDINGKSKGGGSDHPVFDKIRESNPLFYLQMGDIHYYDIKQNDPELYRSAFRSLFSSDRQARLYREVPLVYMWDDHDYGPNNSGADSPSRLAAQQTYREFVPHHRLAASPSDAAIYQSFNIGRVLFVLTDLRSHKSANSSTDDKQKSMLGLRQKEWLKSKLIEGRDSYKLTVWVNTVPWIHDEPGEDQWGGYQTEREELSLFILHNDVKNLCVLSGDSHMVAIDDGSHNTFADGKTPLFPIFQAAALHRPGSVKGGPYSHGTYPGPGQYGLMEITDQGGSAIHVKWTGISMSKGVLVEYSFSR